MNARAELLALYNEVDAIMAPFSCDSSTECCRFGITGREPYPHAVELAEVEHAMRASPPPKKKKTLVVVGKSDERACPLLSEEGRCRIYASRPFGCRTFFCDRVVGPGKIPRDRVNEIGRKIASLSARAFPLDPGPRALTKVI